jgi:glycosyltransferase involved in cell wall biosynthesis
VDHQSMAEVREGAAHSSALPDQVPTPSLLGFATQGSGEGEEARLRELTRDLPIQLIRFDRSARFSTFLRVFKAIRENRPRMVIMEGSGVAGGFALLLGRLLFRVPYVVSSGDAIAPFLASRVPLLKPAFLAYERLLYRFAAGFIGWTPYLVGRALSFGAPRAMTAQGWSSFTLAPDERVRARARLRNKLGIPSDALVIGIVGALVWNARVRYCYGYELVNALKLVKRRDVVALIVGDGDGKAELAAAAGAMIGSRLVLAGRAARQEVPEYLAAMDIVSLPQSVDQVGSFRYTTKISEYLAAGLPIVTGQIPLAYDLDQGWLWRLPGSSPWARTYIESLARLIDQLAPAEIAAKTSAIPRDCGEFDRERQVARATAFITDLLRDQRE